MKKQILILSLLFANFVFSNEEPQIEIDPAAIQTSGWGIGVGMFNIDKQAAFEECVGDSATYLRLSYAGQDGHFMYGAGMSGLLFSDKCKFSQDVVDNWGGRDNASSSASAFGVYGELGYSFALKPGKIQFDLMGGIEKLWGERGIANCSNCYSENIDIDGGFYVMPRMRFINENGFTFAFSYHYYPSSEIENGFSLNFGATYDLF